MKICGECKYHKHIYSHIEPKNGKIDIHEGWVCVNEDSDNAGCYTEYKDSCEEWEEKE